MTHAPPARDPLLACAREHADDADKANAQKKRDDARTPTDTPQHARFNVFWSPTFFRDTVLFLQRTDETQTCRLTLFFPFPFSPHAFCMPLGSTGEYARLVAAVGWGPTPRPSPPAAIRLALVTTHEERGVHAPPCCIGRPDGLTTPAAVCFTVTIR